MRCKMFTSLAMLATAAVTLSLTGVPAEAKRGAPGVTIAESRFGNGIVSGPVRPTKVGPQVRLPGGTWVYCGRSCSETLRIETVDFWENQNGTDNACGIFGCLEVRLPRASHW